MKRTPTLAVVTAILTLTLSTSAWAEARNIVLVHGMNGDGSVWRPVYDILKAQGYSVSVVQLPLTGFEEDVAATQRVVDWQDGSTVLVAHSYGGMVISEVGNDEKVSALVYVAALQPDAGDTMASLNEFMPSQFDMSASKVSSDGFVISGIEAFVRDAAADLPPDLATFLAESQTPTSATVFGGTVTSPAWRAKPSFAIVASQDRTISPDLERWMYERSGARVTELSGSHMIHLSQPDAVAAVIVDAAKSVE